MRGPEQAKKNRTAAPPLKAPAPVFAPMAGKSAVRPIPREFSGFSDR